MEFVKGFNSLQMCLQEMPEKGDLTEAWSRNRMLPSGIELAQTCATTMCATLNRSPCSWMKRSSPLDIIEDEISLMQRSKGPKRHRSPTPRRRRIPARTHARNDHDTRSWHERRATWLRKPPRRPTEESRPSCITSWAPPPPPWKRRGGAPRDDREPARREGDGEGDEVEVVNESAGPSTGVAPPPTPVFDDGIRTWGELTGILDPMDEPEQLIDPAIVNSSVERMNNMQAVERQRLALDLLRFMALLFAEALRMMSMANLAVPPTGDASSLLQWPSSRLRTLPALKACKRGKGTPDGHDRDAGKETRDVNVVTGKCRQGQGKLLALMGEVTTLEGKGLCRTRDIDRKTVGVVGTNKSNEFEGLPRCLLNFPYGQNDGVIVQATRMDAKVCWQGEGWKHTAAEGDVIAEGEGGFRPEGDVIADGEGGFQSEEDDMETDDGVFMQTNADKFGGLLQKLLGLMEKLEGPVASMRANFLASLLVDVQRPGPHINAAIIERMDRLQALLLSFEGPSEMEMTDNDRDWCLRQWDVLRLSLLDKSLKTTKEREGNDRNASASSSDIVQLEDSQERDGEDGQGSQVAILQNGTTRPLTSEEMAEIAYHEELETQAAECEAKADEYRWEMFRAQCLQDEEDEAMKEAMEESTGQPPHKKARVKVIVEGTGGRVVRSEVFNMAVQEGEALTYKIMVLPRNDPEVQAMRDLQEGRERRDAAGGDEGSNASADTVVVGEDGKPLPEPAPRTNEEMHAFLATEQGEKYYQEWNAGRISCKQVCMRSGAGLLAKFFSRRVEETEEQKMLQAVLEAEEKQKESEETGGTGSRDDLASGHAAGSLPAPSSWPSYARRETKEVIQIDSQVDSQDAQQDEQLMQRDASEFSAYITAEENARELAFAVAAGDVPVEAHGHGDQEECSEEAALHGTVHQTSQGALHETSVQDVLPTAMGASMAVSSGSTTALSEVGDVAVDRGMEVPEGEASATESMSEGQAEGSNSNSPASKQTDLKHWLV